MERREIDLEDAERAERSFRVPKLNDAGLTRLFMDALSHKALLWFTLLLAGGLWTFSAVSPTELRLGAALGATVTVYLPMLFRRMRDR